MVDTHKKVARGATVALRLLWEKGFFKLWCNYSGIGGELDQEDYHFTTPELGMALKRAKYLIHRGKRGSFEYIQKYPYVEESEK